MATVKVVFALTAQGQKEAILSGKGGAQKQTFDVPADHPDFADIILMGIQDKDGNTVLDCSGLYVTEQQHPGANEIGNEKERTHFDRFPTITEIISRERAIRDRIGDAIAVKNANAETERILLIAKFLETPTDSEVHRSTSMARGNDKYGLNYRQADLAIIEADEAAAVHLAAVREAIKAANAEAAAVRLANIEAEKAKKAAQEAEQAKQLDRLKAWGLKNGSEYARELINANFPGWVSETNSELVKNTIAELIDGIELVDVTELEDSQTSKAAEETKKPTLAELKAFKRLEAKAEQISRNEPESLVQIDVLIMRYTYADEDGGDDFSRNEIAVTVETCIGKQSDFFYVVE